MFKKCASEMGGESYLLYCNLQNKWGSFPYLDLTFACAGEGDEVGSIIHEGSQSEYLSILSLSASSFLLLHGGR